MSRIDIPMGLIEALKAARRVVVLTGAGVSAESNIPTFRDALTGLWAKYRPEELATPEAFNRDPKLVWDWYQWRNSLVSNASPNPGHRALVQLESLVPHLTLVTQNVDSLHARAGSSRVLELHGNISRTKCLDENRVVDAWEDTGDVPPRCPSCGGLLRPDVVWFGESLPPDVLAEAAQASSQCDVFFSVGTSAVVFPAASLVYEAMRAGAVTVEINPAPTAQSGELTYALQGPAGEVLPSLIKGMQS